MFQQVFQLNKACFHCGATCNDNEVGYDGKAFCCKGCKSVYEILQSKHLCNYYDFSKQPGVKVDERSSVSSFDYLDADTIKQHIVIFEQEHEVHIALLIPDMHCISCIWLLEHLSDLIKGVLSSRVNFQNKTVYIVFDNSVTTISAIAKTLMTIGYEPVVNFEMGKDDSIEKTSTKRLLKIGVAGFCFINIMMLSFPEYLVGAGSVEAGLAQYFKWIVLFLSLPVLFYCATEFFVSAYKGLRTGILNVELPVSIALLITFARSLYEIFWLNSNGYFDSFSGIVFFMLIGRWVQNNTTRNINFNRDYQSFFPIVATVINGGRRIFKPIKAIAIHDLLEIKHGEIIPCDALLVEGVALIDYSFVTGECNPVAVKKGSILYAGGKQLQGVITIHVEKPVSQSYLTSLWSEDVFNNSKNARDTTVNKVAMYFTYVVLTLAAVAATYWYMHNDTTKMWNAFTTVLIVACPCALLLSEHFTNGNILGILGINGFYLRSKNVLYSILKIDTIIFDKTGTLTSSRQANVQYIGQDILPHHLAPIASLLSQTGHPLSVAIASFLSIKNIEQIKNFKVVDGAGVEGWVNETHYKAGNALFLNRETDNAASAQVHISLDSVYCGYYEIKQQYRGRLESFITSLREMYRLAIVSGDNNAEETYLKKIFGADAAYHFNASPIDKLTIVKQIQASNHQVLYVGDGLNDAGALKESTVGISVCEKNSLFTPACDAILDAVVLTNLLRYIEFIKRGRKIIWWSFLVSSIYNVAGLWFALQGILSPLVAAILMPLSSLTIIGFTYYSVLIKAHQLQLKTKVL